MTDIDVKTTKGFNNEGKYAKRGSTITISPQRAKDLYANGLIEDPKLESQAPAPESKKAPEAANKAAPKSGDKAKPATK